MRSTRCLQETHETRRDPKSEFVHGRNQPTKQQKAVTQQADLWILTSDNEDLEPNLVRR